MNVLTPKTEPVTVTPYAVTEALRLRFPPKTIAAFLTILILLAVVFVVPPIPHQGSYLASFIDKERLLRDTCGERRIIFVGGSNSAFGVDGRLVQKRLHTKTINAGVHAAIGMRYTLNALRPYVGPGDIIVIVPEYNVFFKLLDGSTELFQLLWLHPQGLRHLAPEHAKTIARAIPDIIKRKWNFWSLHGVHPEGSSPIYNRLAFNHLGDVVAHLDKPNDHTDFNDHYNIGGAYDHRAVGVLNDFCKWCQNRGAKVLLSFPAIPISLYKFNLELPGTSGVLIVQNELEQKFCGTILDTPLHNCYDPGMFFNNVYHLNKDGRRLRTEALIERLRPFVETRGSITSDTN